MKTRKSGLWFLTVCASLGGIAGCGPRADEHDAKLAERWNSANEPFVFTPNQERAFSRLPLDGAVRVRPWSDTYWANNEGGIAFRWRSNELGFNYALVDRNRVQNFTPANIERLSPAEKYDIYMGRYDFPTVTSERRRTSRNEPSWHGLCHGWAPAALLYDEPRSVTLRGANGVTIPFGSSDVKALLTYYHGVLFTRTARFLGQRCNSDLGVAPSDGNRPECADVNAGSFHLVLTNEVGMQKRSFIADVSRGEQVWNQPIESYRTKVLGRQGPSPGAAQGTREEVRLETTVVYTVETQPSSGPSRATSAMAFRYRVELDGSGKIIGGAWEGTDRPDFLWMQERPTFSGYYASVKTIYDASVGRVQPNPQPTPVVRPTVQPTPIVRPTVQPTPIVINPNPGSNALVCAGGSYATRAGGGFVCTDGTNAYGPFNPTLQRRCVDARGGSACYTERWSLNFYLGLRGTGRCPVGASLNSATGFCEEAGNAYGPFPRWLVDRCVAAGGDARVCSSSRWNASLLRSFF